MSTFGTITAGRLILKSQQLATSDSTSTTTDLLGRQNNGQSQVELSYDFLRTANNSTFEDLIIGSASSTWTSPGRVTLQALAVGDRVVRQSYLYTAGIPGGSRIAYFGVQCAANDTSSTGARVRFGLYDEKTDKSDPSLGHSGLFFQVTDGIIVLVRRLLESNDEIVGQSSWNGDPSYTFDPTRSDVFIIELNSSGIGRMGVLRAGQPTILHTFQLGSSGLATLPVRYELSHLSGGQHDMQMLSGCVIAEGPISNTMKTSVFGLGATPKLVTSSRTPVISIRLQADCREKVRVELADTFSEGSVLWEVLSAGTLTGAQWVEAVEEDSSVEVDAMASTITSGVVVTSTYTSAGQTANISIDVPLLSTIAGVSIPVTLCCTSLTQSSTSVYGNLRWLE